MAKRVTVINPKRGALVVRNPDFLEKLAGIFQTTADQIRDVAAQRPPNGTVKDSSSPQALAVTKKNPTDSNAALAEQLDNAAAVIATQEEQLDDLSVSLTAAAETVGDLAEQADDFKQQADDLQERLAVLSSEASGDGD